MQRLPTPPMANRFRGSEPLAIVRGGGREVSGVLGDHAAHDVQHRHSVFVVASGMCGGEAQMLVRSRNVAAILRYAAEEKARLVLHRVRLQILTEPEYGQ